MKVEVEKERLQREIGRYRRDRIPQERRELIDTLGQSALQETIELNPVETGRSRAGWVASLLRLGGSPSASWSGGTTDEAALHEGRSGGDLQRVETRDRSEIRATNDVEYINFLEYGTWKMSAFAMVRRALMRVAERLRRRG